MELEEESSSTTSTEKKELPMNSDGFSWEKNGSLEKISGDFSFGGDGEDGISRAQVVEEGASGSEPGGEAKSTNSDQIAIESGLLMKKEDLRYEKDGLNASSVEGRIENDDSERKGNLLRNDGDSVVASISSSISQQATAGTPSPETPSPDRQDIMTKGKGLRKWRRRRRAVVKDGNAGHDLHRAHKRGLSNIDPQHGPGQPGSMDNKLRSEEPVASVDSTIGLGFFPPLKFGASLRISNSGSFLVPNAFVAPSDSQESEDQTSKFSTTASFPRLKHESEARKGQDSDQVNGSILLHGPDNQSKETNLDDGSKKFRAESGNDGEFDYESLGNHLEGEGSSKIDEQGNDQADSYSSLESDSRSSARIGSSATDALVSTNSCFPDQRNGRWIQEGKQGWSSDCDGEVDQFECRDGKEAQVVEKHKSEEPDSDYSHENGVELESGLRKEESGATSGSNCQDVPENHKSFDTSGSNCQDVPENHKSFEQVEAKREGWVRPVKPVNQNRKSPAERDPWIDSLAQLQIVQEALKKEIQKVEVIRKEAFSLPAISSHVLSSIDKNETIIPTSSDADGKFQIDGNGGASIEFLPSLLHHRIMILQNRLKDAETMIQHKEGRVKKFEAALAEANIQKDESYSDLQLLEKMFNEMETEIEYLFTDKVEAEIKYFVVNEATEELKSLVEDQLPIVESYKLLREEQSLMLNKLKVAEQRALSLKSRAEELETVCSNLSATEKVFEVQGNVSKFSFFCFVQLILLFIALRFFLFQLSPFSPGVVPT